MIGLPLRPPFLTAHWRWLVMASYAIDPRVLEPHVPSGTTLDLWQGQALVSVVGFRFLQTRLRGIPIPFHRDFDEVNLRFYVRRVGPGGAVRRGVVFIREFVPRRTIALVARLAYNEPYTAVEMRSATPATPGASSPGSVTFEWRVGGRWQRLGAVATGDPATAAAESEAAFITEHHWGYTRQRNGATIEYEVAHPAWRTWAASDATLDVDAARVYGAPFVDALASPPASVLIADGSPVWVYPPRRIASRA